jgi:light-regulated signal transduction histidine kinase (bacteriophytochrome)
VSTAAENIHALLIEDNPGAARLIREMLRNAASQSAARALVELHGGRLWAETTPGEASTFLVTLPK